MPWHTVDETFAVSIGGMSFDIHSDEPLVLPDPSSSYSDFVSGGNAADSRIRIDVHMSGCPDVASMDVLFDADDAWSLRQGVDGQYFVGHGPPSLDAPPWVLRIEDSARATVYGNPNIVDGAGTIICPMTYPVDQLLCINTLADREGMLVHCAGLRVGEKIYIFAGKSGAGKSTFSECVSERDGVSLISDDRMIIRKVDNKFFAFGTPWPGDAGYAKNESAELGGIYFLEHAEDNVVTDVAQREAVERLLAVTSVPWYDDDRMGGVMRLIGDLTNDVRCEVLDFRPGADAGVYIVERLKKAQK